MRLRACTRRLPRAGLALKAILIVLGASSAAIVVDAVARARLDTGVLAAPTRFYARPMLLRPGSEVNTTRISTHLDRLGYRRTSARQVGIGEYRLTSSQWVIGQRAFRHFDRVYPGGTITVRLAWGDYVSSIRDGDGDALSYVVLEPELIRAVHGDANEDRVPIPLDDVPQHLVDAVLTIEDQRFFDHPGLDVRRIVGATIANIKARRIAQGASTLTQQLARNLFLSSRRSVIRKVREAAMALMLEWRYSKEEILEAYLNQVYLGQDGALAIHGMGRAAQFYFGKDVSQLDLTEGAVLAGIIRGPSLYSPARHPDAATARRDLVLRLMQERGLITEDAYGRATRARLRLQREPERTRSAGYFTDFAAAELRAGFGKDALEQGLAVFTTLDMELQRVAESAVRDELRRLERQYPRLQRADSPLQAALVALDPRSGEILAMVGGRDYGRSQFNRAVDAHRQPGSAFKPVVALTALAEPRGDQDGSVPEFTLASTLRDEPLTVETPAGPWQPVNYDGRYRGELTLRDALERSLNVPFARLGVAVGAERIVATARDLGITSPLRPFPSIALGAFEVTPLELTRAYGVFAAQGYRAEQHAALAVIDRSGEVLRSAESNGEQVYTPAEAYLVTSALQGAVQRGTGQGLRSLGVRSTVAAKSGTTNDFRDGWFIAYTPSLVVGVWVGFDDGQSLGAPGSRVALPIVGRFLAEALDEYGNEDFPIPSGVEIVDVDPETGLRGGPGCWGEPEVFLRGTAPERSCSPYWASSRRSRSSSRVVDDLRRLWDELRQLLDREH
jgi:penicillin-binding protein 1B